MLNLCLCRNITWHMHTVVVLSPSSQQLKCQIKFLQPSTGRRHWRSKVLQLPATMPVSCGTEGKCGCGDRNYGEHHLPFWFLHATLFSSWGVLPPHLSPYTHIYINWTHLAVHCKNSVIVEEKKSKFLESFTRRMCPPYGVLAWWLCLSRTAMKHIK